MNSEMVTWPLGEHTRCRVIKSRYGHWILEVTELSPGVESSQIHDIAKPIGEVLVTTVELLRSYLERSKEIPDKEESECQPAEK
jgi:hypothetical protein